MPRAPDGPIFGHLAEEFRHHRQSQTPAAAPVNLETTTREEPMSLSADLHAIADRLDKLGEEIVTKTEAIVASPAGTAGLEVLHAVTGLNIDPKIIDEALGGLRSLLLAYAPDPALTTMQPAQTPAPAGQ